MSKSKELAKNTAILFIGTFFTKIISYLLLPLYTAYLSTAEYGTVELFTTIVSLLLPIVGLQVDAGVFRFLIKYRDNEDNKEKIISTTFAFILCSICIYFIVFILVSFFINNQYKWLVLLNLIFATISSYIQQVSRGLGKNNDYSISSIVVAIARVIVTVVLLVGVHLKVDAMLYGGCAAYLAGIIYLIIRLRLFDYIKTNQINKESLKEVLSYSLPMIPNALSWWIFSSSDRIIISRFVGLDATGILSIGYKFSNIIVVIYSVFNMSLSESIALHIDDEDISDYFNKTYNFVSNIFTSVGIGLLAFMPIAFPILINANFNEAYNLMPFTVLSAVLQVFAATLGVIYVAKNNTKNIAVTSIIAAIVNITTDLLLVKYIGVYAAPVSTIISYIVLLGYRYIDANKKYFEVRFDSNTLLNIASLVSVISILYFSVNPVIQITNMVIAFILVILFNVKYFKYIKKLINKVIKR